jgi:hypothetical protein
LPDVRFDSNAFGACPPRADRYSLHCGKTTALNGTILVVSSLRRGLSGMPIIEQLASDDLLNAPVIFVSFQWVRCIRRNALHPMAMWRVRFLVEKKAHRG